MTPERLAKQKAVVANLVRAAPGKTALLCIVEQTSPAPRGEHPTRSAKRITDHGLDLACIACVIEGSGFQSAIARCVLSLMSLMILRRQAPIAFVESVAKAAAWMLQYSPFGSVPELVETVERMRAEIPAA